MIRRLYSVGDAALNQYSPDRNYGGVPEVQTSGPESYAVVKFYLPPDLFNYNILSAKLCLYFTQASTATYIRIHKILEPWVEGTGTYGGDDWTNPERITYNNAPLIDSTYIEYYMSSTLTGGQWREISILNDLSFPSRYGWAIKNRPNANRWWHFVTKEGTAGRTPYLEIVYTFKTPVISLRSERIISGFKLTWNKQAINYYQPSSYRVFKYNPVVNEYVFVTTLDSNTFEYIDYELFDYDYEYKYCIDARYNDEGTWKYTNPVFVVGGTLYKSDVPQVELAAVGGQSAMRHLINTTHSESFDELNNIEISTWKKSLDATSVSRDVDLRLTGDGNTLTKNILPIDDSNLGDADNRWLEIHSEELKTDTSKTAKLRLWNGR